MELKNAVIGRGEQEKQTNEALPITSVPRSFNYSSREKNNLAEESASKKIDEARLGQLNSQLADEEESPNEIVGKINSPNIVNDLKENPELLISILTHPDFLKNPTLINQIKENNILMFLLKSNPEIRKLLMKPEYISVKEKLGLHI